MTTKIRKQIYLDPEQERLIKHLSASSGLSEAEIIRQSIDNQRGRVIPCDVSVWFEEKQFIKEWLAQGYAEGGRDWTREDLYDR